MNGEVFIHVGLQKTGTTWIQEELFKKMNVQYFHNMDYTTYIEPDKKTIISMEWLMGVPHWRDMSPYANRFQIIDRFHAIFPHAKVIIGVRDRYDWIVSLYSQYVKNGGVKRFNGWLRMFDFRFIEFERYIDYVKDKFPAIYIYFLEDLIKDKKTFAEDLCEFVGEPVPEYCSRIYNKSFPKHKLFVMRQINKLFVNRWNTKAFFPGILGEIERFLIKKISESWQ